MCSTFLNGHCALFELIFQWWIPLTLYCTSPLSSLYNSVSGLFQRLSVLLRLLLPLPHLWHSPHRGPAGALQEPELKQEPRGQERSAAPVDQRAPSQLLPNLPGPSSPQPTPRLSGVTETQTQPRLTFRDSLIYTLFSIRRYLSVSSPPPPRPWWGHQKIIWASSLACQSVHMTDWLRPSSVEVSMTPVTADGDA